MREIFNKILKKIINYFNISIVSIKKFNKKRKGYKERGNIHPKKDEYFKINKLP